ncbi:MAG: hypothetical protein WDN49_19240 [Acetobacteraceae bacterium]
MRITACGHVQGAGDLDQPVAVHAVGMDQQLAAARHQRGHRRFVGVGRAAGHGDGSVLALAMDQPHQVAARGRDILLEVLVTEGAVDHHHLLGAGGDADRARRQQ